MPFSLFYCSSLRFPFFCFISIIYSNQAQQLWGLEYSMYILFLAFIFLTNCAYTTLRNLHYMYIGILYRHRNRLSLTSITKKWKASASGISALPQCKTCRYPMCLARNEEDDKSFACSASGTAILMALGRKRTESTRVAHFIKALKRWGWLMDEANWKAGEGWRWIGQAGGRKSDVGECIGKCVGKWRAGGSKMGGEIRGRENDVSRTVPTR